MPSWNEVPDETPIDPSGLVDRSSIRCRRDLSVAEARNIVAAIAKYLSRKPTRRSAPFDYGWCVKLHREMFGKVWTWAGSTRREDLNIGVSWRQVPERLEQLLQALHEWSGYDVPLGEQAARLHHTAVQIHPFLGGNGRWARLLANIWLKMNGETVVSWPEATIGSSSVARDEYIAAIKEADLGRIETLIRLQVRFSGDR